MLLTLTSCLRDDDLSYEVYDVSVQLINPISSKGLPEARVTMSTTMGNVWQATTDSDGIANFVLPLGLYDLTASGSYSSPEDIDYVMNCSSANICINSTTSQPHNPQASQPQNLQTFTMTASRRGSLVIKEVYNGGCQKDDGSGAYHNDKYVSLCNNGQLPLTVGGLCLAMAAPYNAHATNGNYLPDGSLSYAADGFLPAIQAVWHFADSLRLDGGEEVVIALNGAVDHTVSYSLSVDLSHSEYYCTYDPLVFTNTSYYPVPSQLIPADHYLTAVFYGQGNAWPFSQLDPAFYIFSVPEGIDIQAYAADQSHLWYNNGTATAPNACLRIPVDWILDGVEIFTTSSTANKKRLTDAVDAGAVYLTNCYGYSVYRCVDAEATRAIPENAGLLVELMPATPDASQGVVPADPSGIDAEASRRQGATIIYQDTNNSSNDFFERYQAALRD